MQSLRRANLLWSCWLLLALPLPGGDLDVDGVLAARGVRATGQTTWLAGGYGRLRDGGGGPEDAMSAARGDLHLGIAWRPSDVWSVRVQGVVQGEPRSYRGRQAGIVEAFAQFRSELTPHATFRLRGGTFFPQTSLENTDPLWQSPHTITLSALNTWTAEELRLTGLDAAFLLKDDRGNHFEAAGAAFGANDTLGALIAWRGWTMGDRLTTVGESLPLPPLSTFAPGGAFGEQRAGTRPVDELDRRVGWQARGRWWRPEAELRAAYLQNRGDRRLHRGQYSWATSFTTVGVQLGGSLRLLAEGAFGDTGMGPAVLGASKVDLRFRVGYVLLSWGREKWRLSARIDGFRNEDRDGTAEPDDEEGWGWTVAGFWQPDRALRLGAEYVEVRSQRPAAAFSKADPDTNGRRALIELRVRF